MPDSGDCQAALDPNFVETVGVLNSHGIPYWACHGTLLGLVRDGRLIPWDHDVDIALWTDAIPKGSLIDLMAANGFSLKDDGADYDFVAFTKEGGRTVDFNYYHACPDSGMAYSEWFIIRSKFAALFDLLANRSEYHGRWSAVVRRLYFLRPLARIMVSLLKWSGLLYRSAGYTTPVCLLEEFEPLEIAGVAVRVPCRREAILEYVYGNDWRLPKQKYDWTKESPATRVSDSRFQ